MAAMRLRQRRRMTSLAAWSTVVCVAILFYTYFGYPLGIAVAAKWFGRTLRTDGPLPDGVAIVIAARNERGQIERRIRELSGQLSELTDANHVRHGEIIVAVNGSTDDTAEAARDLAIDRLRVIQTDAAGGKALALSTAIGMTKMPVVALADARQRWADGSILAMLEAMRDPDVGGVSGELMLEQSPGVMAGVGLYWKYEKWIRRNESKLWSQIGVTGAICAVRREKFVRVPPGTILDDVCWPMNIAARGGRVVFSDRAVAFDQLPTKNIDEQRRKVRTLAGNFQLVARYPWWLIPGLNRVWLRFVSHKLMRLLCPWAFVGMIIGGVMTEHFAGLCLAAMTLALVIAGILGLTTTFGAKNRLLSTAGSFVLLNWSAALATWYTMTGQTHRLWTR